MTKFNTEPQDITLETVLDDLRATVYVDSNGNNTIDDYDLREAKQALLQWRDKAVAEARKEEHTKARQLYAKRNPQFTRKWIADLLGISRPTLNKWLKDPELFTVGAIRKLGALKETPNED